MKPVVKACIGRTAFTLEEEAYNILKEYLDSLEKHFSQNPSGKEIMEEIEVRLAELLSEKCSSSGVVSVQMAREACDTLGSVKDIDEEPESSGDNGKKARKLFRNPDDKILGGVCSGLAAYFDKDTILFRIIAIGIFLLFALTAARAAFWVPVAAYLALWLAIPEARTVGQRYQMRGEKNTVESIMYNAGKGAREIGNSARQFNKEHPDLLRTVERSVSAIVGILLILISFTALIALALSAAGASLALPVSLATLFSSLAGPGNVTLCIIAIMATLGIPFICILYSGILMTFNLKSPKWKPGLLLFLAWIAGLGILGYLGASSAIYFDSGERLYSDMDLGSGSRDLRIVMENSDADYDYIYLDADEDCYKLVMTDGDKVYLYPTIRLCRDQEAEGIEVRETSVRFTEKNMLPDFCTYSDGVLSIAPTVLDKDSRIREIGREAIIRIPASTQVQVEPPRYHDFSTEQCHTNIRALKDGKCPRLF